MWRNYENSLLDLIQFMVLLSIECKISMHMYTGNFFHCSFFGSKFDEESEFEIKTSYFQVEWGLPWPQSRKNMKKPCFSNFWPKNQFSKNTRLPNSESAYFFTLEKLLETSKKMRWKKSIFYLKHLHKHGKLMKPLDMSDLTSTQVGLLMLRIST